MCIRFFRPRATGRIEFSARLVLSSNSGYCKKHVRFFHSVNAYLQALLSALQNHALPMQRRVIAIFADNRVERRDYELSPGQLRMSGTTFPTVRPASLRVNKIKAVSSRNWMAKPFHGPVSEQIAASLWAYCGSSSSSAGRLLPERRSDTLAWR